MSLRHFASAVLLVVVAVPASAGILGGKKLPRAISYVDKRVDRSDRVGGIVKHPPAKYSKPGWGSRFDLVRDNYPPRPLTPFLMHQER
jgi:hypothetical protein